MWRSKLYNQPNRGVLHALLAGTCICERSFTVHLFLLWTSLLFIPLHIKSPPSMDDEDDGLLNIALSSDSEAESKPLKPKRTEQTESAFQAIKQSYVPKIENGNIYKSITLPLPTDAKKHHFQEVIHAVEELYFFRRFSEALAFIHDVFGSDRDRGILDQETNNLLKLYESKCQHKLANNS